MAEFRFEMSEWSTGPEKMGGRNYIEVRVRDRRKRVVGYALCESVEEAESANAEFKRDFGAGR